MNGLFDNLIIPTQVDVKKTLSKAKNKKTDDLDIEKVIKSKSISLAEKLSVINERVLRVLGKQKDNVLVIKDQQTFEDYVTKAINFGRVAIDTETNNSTDPCGAETKLMGLCLYYEGGKQAYIPVNHTDFNKNRLTWQLTEEDCRKQLQRILDANIIKVMHNGKFDYEVICQTCNIRVAPDWDTLVAARLIDENKYSEKRTSLKWIYINEIDPSQEKYSIDKLFENIPYQYVDPDIFALYAATDSMMTDKVYVWELPQIEAQVPHIEKIGENYTREVKGGAWLFHNIEMPLVQVTAEMEMVGVEIDEELGARLKDKYNKKLEYLDSEIDKLLQSLDKLIAIWKTKKVATVQSKVYAPKKTKTSPAKLALQYPCTDKDGNRYKVGKSKALQLETPINLSSPVQLAILFYDILLKDGSTSPDTKEELDTPVEQILDAITADENRKTGKDDLKAIKEKLAFYINKEDDFEEEEDAFSLLDDAIERNDSNKIETFKRTVAADLCSLLLERRGYAKLITTYLDTIPTLAKHWPDNRIRFRLNSTGTDTGRYSSGGKWHWLDENDNDITTSGINIQNIPSRGDGKITRMLFKAKDGYKIIGSDYSAQEPRLSAYMSRDDNMINAYLNGQDLYAVIAQSMYDNNYEDNLEFYPAGTELDIDGHKVIAGNKTHLNKAGKERRAAGKTMQLATCYGMSGATAGQRMGKSKEEGQALMDKFFSKFSKLKTVINDSKENLQKMAKEYKDAKVNHLEHEAPYVEDWVGRRRHLPDYVLDPYEVHLENESPEFNPFLVCEDKQNPADLVLKAKWEQAVKDKVAASQEWQKKNRPGFKGNNEMSNTAHKKLAQEALQEHVIIRANTGRIAQAERQCFNARIQGGAASLTKLAMVNIFKDERLRSMGAYLIITVHDEVLVECPEQYADEVEKILPEIMVNTAKEVGIDVPMKCDPYNVTRWYCDEYAVAIQDEYKKLEKSGLSKEEALDKLYNTHTELPPAAILKTVETGCDLDF